MTKHKAHPQIQGQFSSLGVQVIGHEGHMLYGIERKRVEIKGNFAALSSSRESID